MPFFFFDDRNSQAQGIHTHRVTTVTQPTPGDAEGEDIFRDIYSSRKGAAGVQKHIENQSQRERQRDTKQDISSLSDRKKKKIVQQKGRVGAGRQQPKNLQGTKHRRIQESNWEE